MPRTCSPTHSCVIRRPRATEQGISLVELMVAMAVGLVVVLIATTIYVEGLRNFSFRTSQSENLGNSRYALGTLDDEFTKAGYRRDPTQAMDEAFPADGAAHPNGCKFAVGQAIYAVDTGTLCIRYQARDNNEKDCAGAAAGVVGLGAYEAPPAPALGAGMFVERYFLSGGSLVCRGGSQSEAKQEVADGVRDVHFEFGVGKGSDSFAERRVEAFKATTPAADEVIRSLRYAILLAASAEKITGGMDSSVCTRWEGVGGTKASCDASKGQLYQLASGSLTLRNLMP
ncbi:prepilin-type N-terminal cleavage/methylation domain-containing protein [Variovorax sp. E3]|uniref:prepilin-type N-terminal cleavage/methylation domain-containing protein n=1 Tax=Variovorax sp. E3 TaxID=1914993 RepID=UPI0022B6D4FB|nr:prepilin-type N-terminal cleavage/methylation domain-containing protein [Variovorax sp. E3]